MPYVRRTTRRCTHRQKREREEEYNGEKRIIYSLAMNKRGAARIIFFDRSERRKLIYYFFLINIPSRRYLIDTNLLFIAINELILLILYSLLQEKKIVLFKFESLIIYLVSTLVFSCHRPNSSSQRRRYKNCIEDWLTTRAIVQRRCRLSLMTRSSKPITLIYLIIVVCDSTKTAGHHAWQLLK